MLGLYVSDHPLLGVEHILAGRRRLLDRRPHRRRTPDGQIVTVGGLLSGLQRKVTKKGDSWALIHAGGPRGRDRGDDLPLGVPAVLDAARRGRDPRRQGPPGQARGRREDHRDGGRPARPDRHRRRPAAVGHAAARPRARRRSSSASRRSWSPTPARPRCTCSCRTARAPPWSASTTSSASPPSPALMGDLKQLLGPACLG